MNILELATFKEWIDNADYEQLLYKWRYAPIGDPVFSGDSESGEYYKKVMLEKKKSITPEMAVRVSKKVGCCL